MAMMPFQPNEKKRSTEDHSPFSDGIDLGLGSVDLKRRVADMKGLDVFEQEAIATGKSDMDDYGINGKDEWHDDLAARNAASRSATIAQEEYVDATRVQGRRRVAANRIAKTADSEALMREARHVVSKTESTKDDAYVSRKLPSILEDVINDPSNSALTDDDYSSDFGL